MSHDLCDYDALKTHVRYESMMLLQLFPREIARHHVTSTRGDDIARNKKRRANSVAGADVDQKGNDSSRVLYCTIGVP